MAEGIPTARLTRADVARMLPVDDRLARSTMDLASSVAADLNATIDSTSGGFALPDEAWQMFVLYYAARIYGAFSGCIMLRAHTCDREAQFLERAMYEYYTKMLFYSIFKEDAKAAFLSFPRQHVRLIKRMKYQPSRFLTEDQLQMVESAVDYNGDANFADVQRRLIASSQLISQSERPTVGFYLRQPQDRFNVHWVAPSQTVHGSILDILAAWNLEETASGDLSFTGELDSLQPIPNGRLLDSCEFAVHTALLIGEEFAVPEPPGREALLKKLAAALGDVGDLDATLGATPSAR